MKKTIFLILGVFLVGLSSGLAQKYSSEADYMSKVYEKDKRTLMSEYLKLSDEEAEKFWPVYDLYEKERQVLGEQRFAMLQKYMNEYEDMTPEQAKSWINRIFEFRVAYSTHLENFTRGVQAQVGGKRALQFYELETYFRTDIRDRIYSEYPFVNE